MIAEELLGQTSAVFHWRYLAQWGCLYRRGDNITQQFLAAGTRLTQEFSGGSVWQEAEREVLVILFNSKSYLTREY